ncbi:YbcC family protein [Runella sp.]|uniref:YbcC family protein n=1 Tax=Runella sp. TaxID=1960881 RepID=UPI003D0D8A32
MKTHDSLFDEHEVLHDLKHFLPAQAPLKDFIHHNTLHAFQQEKFYDATQSASEILGYKVSLSLDEYRALYESQRIRKDILDKIIVEKKGAKALSEWQKNLLTKKYEKSALPRIGALRANWKKHYRVDLDSLVHPILFRVLCSYLDQGISIWNFPIKQKTFLASMRELEKNSFTSIFRASRAKDLLLNSTCEIEDLLETLVGDKELNKQYLFDQQFAHQGWSGMVSAIEDQPQSLLDQRKISLHDLVVFELLLEIDALDFHCGNGWLPLKNHIVQLPIPLFAPIQKTELNEVMTLWQEAFEWSYYDQVLTGLQNNKTAKTTTSRKSFQAMFCIDDRECSLRRYLEEFDPACETFGTPGFFGVEFFYQPEDGKFYTKVCPAPVTPKYLIKEVGNKNRRQKDVHFTKHSHSFYSGWLISQTLGFWSAVKLFANIFSPSMSPATASSFKHMDKFSTLTIENKHGHSENNLQIGFTIDEMAIRVENLLKSIGLVENFAPIVYVIGHGSSSVNNPHYAAYDCGACAGRAGSVNSRVISFMANHPKVRAILSDRGIVIPADTQFIGGLHDTTRDEIVYFDENSLSPKNLESHNKNEVVFEKALDYNAKERSRRFESIDTTLSPKKIHEKVKTRSVSLFEPRPELNHATNALCIIGRRSLSKGVFLDRRAFLNSFSYKVDPEGKYLLNILNAAAPVCGGINLEYFFSRVDNQKLGAGTKLPHNVMGLFGVANGIDGDLRPGLPSQMIEVHDPVRLLMIVEHLPDVVLATIQKNPATYEWFINEWVNLAVINPETNKISVFKNGEFVSYKPLENHIDSIDDITHLLETHQENLPVYSLS